MVPELSRRSVLAIGAAALAAPRVARPNVARAEAATAPAATLAYSRRIGELEFVALSDGYLTIDNAFLNAATDQVNAALEAAYLDPAAPQYLGVTAHLVRGGGRTLLIDTGSGEILGRMLGQAAAALASLGVAPEDVDAVLLTHMHANHMGGLLAGGAAAFPRATLHVNATDLAYWTDETNAGQAHPATFATARDIAAAYGDRVTPFGGNVEVLPGITAVALPGHTVGHTGFLVATWDAQVLVFGDTAHSAAVQFRHPEASLPFDTDPTEAAATRAKLFDRLATDRTLVAGTHLPFPGIGHIARSGTAYAWVPEEWQYQ